MSKLLSLSRVGAGRVRSTTKRSCCCDSTRNFELITQAQQYWSAMERFRRDRERNKRYLYGDARTSSDYQWLQEVYQSAADKSVFCTRWVEFGYGLEQLYNYDFFVTADVARCRVIEICRKESKCRYRCHDWNTGEVYMIELKDKGVMVDAENARRLSLARANGIALDDVPLIDCEWFVDDF